MQTHAVPWTRGGPPGDGMAGMPTVKRCEWSTEVYAGGAVGAVKIAAWSLGLERAGDSPYRTTEPKSRGAGSSRGPNSECHEGLAAEHSAHVPSICNLTQ